MSSSLLRTLRRGVIVPALFFALTLIACGPVWGQGIGLGIGLGFYQHKGGLNNKIEVGTPITVVGDSMTYGDFRAKSYLYWLSLALDGRLFLPQTVNKGTSTVYGANAGVSGNTTAQIAARASTFHVHDGVYVLLTGQNDGAGVTAANQQSSFSSIFSELVDAKKIYVVPFAETTTVAASSTLQARNATNKAWLQGYGGNVVLLPDTVWNGIALHNGSGGTGPQSYDGIHFNVNGAWKLGVNIAAAIESDLATGDVYDLISLKGFSTNLWAADFSGTGGTVGSGASGQVATGLALTTSNTTGLTVTASKGTIDGKPSQIINITGTSSTGTIYVRLRETATHTFDINDGFLICGRIKATSSDGISAPVGMIVTGASPTGGRHAFLNQASPDSESGGAFAYEGIFSGTPEINGAGSTSILSDVEIRVRPSTSVDIRIEVADIKIFNQTQELFFLNDNAFPNQDRNTWSDDGFWQDIINWRD